MSRVRLRLPGAISFAAAVYGQIVGLLFSVLIARRLNPETFGLWAYIGTLVSYSLIPVNLIGSWIGRDAARGRKVMVPSLVSGSILIPAGAGLYIAASSLTYSQVGSTFNDLLLGLLVLVPNSLVNLYLAIAWGHAPQFTGLGSMAFETVKLIAALVLVLGLGDPSLRSVITAVFVGHLAYLSVLAYGVRGTLGRENVGEELARWFRGSVVNALSLLVGQVYSLDVIMMSLFTGGTLVTAHWQAAFTISLLVNATGNLIGGLYPRLLSGGDVRDALKSLHFMMTLGVPALFGSVVLSDYLLSVLNPVYSGSWPAASLLLVSTFVGLLSNYYGTLILASERIDEEGVPTVRQYLRSRLSFGLYVSALTAPSYLVPIALVLAFLRLQVNLLVTVLAAVKTVVTIVQLVIYSSHAAKYTGFRVQFRELVPYFASGAIMAMAVTLGKIALSGPERGFLSTLTELSSLTGLGAMIYFASLYATSSQFRQLLKEVRVFVISLLK
ncbi:MAG: hypothetical protein NYU90_01005 [Aigarchaeota archaeon]|nr:hypothetical protein [Candidatus Calditenuis fumarioli]